MNLHALVVLFLLTVCLRVGEGAESFKQIKIFVADKAVLDRVWSTGIDFEGAVGKVGEWMEFVAGSQELAKLQSQGIPYDIVIDDLTASYASRLSKEPVNSLGFGLGSMGGFYTFAEVLQQLDSMRLLFPSLITVRDSVGRSIENRALWAVKISDNPSTNEPNEPEVLYTALHHAREPEGMMVIVYYMWWLLQNYGNNPDATYLVNNRQMWFIPVQNPDGYVYNQITNPSGGGMWRKNRRNNGGSFGVDPNRNYGPMYMWNAPNGGSSTTPSSDTYRGSAPFSEPENQAIDNFMRTHNIKTCFNYHTYGNYLIYPWGYLSQENGDSLIYRGWTYDMIFANHYTNGTDQQTVAYSTRGNSDDYMFGDTTKSITYAMTPEVGTTGFWPSTAEIFPLAVENLNQNKSLSYLAGQFPSLRRHSLSDIAGNGFLDPGESLSLDLLIKNIGRGTATNLSIAVSSSASYIHFPQPTQTLSTLASQAEVSATFSGNADVTAPSPASFNIYVVFSDLEGFSKTDTLSYLMGTPTVVFVDSATNGTTNWSTGQGWGITSNAHTSPNAFTDSPAGNYGANANNAMTLNSQLSLTGFSYAQMKFWTKWAIEPTWDFATVEISTNNGSSWTTLRTRLSHSGSARSGSQQPAGAWGYESYTPGGTWIEENVDLSSYINKQIKLRFRLAADGAEQRDGFYVDDIRVYGYATPPAPSAPVLNLPPDGSVNQPVSLMLQWNHVGNVQLYRLQVSTDSLFASTVVDDSTLTDTTLHIGPIDFETHYYWHVRASNIAGAGPWSAKWGFTTSSQLARQYPVLDGWNMVSVPLNVSNYQDTTLFPTAVSQAYAFEGGYVVRSILANGVGYWLKFNGAQSVLMTGTLRTLDTIGVSSGWNLIGSISDPVRAIDIGSIPPGIITSEFYEYQVGYQVSDTIKPGQAYWVRLSQGGHLILSSSSVAGRILIVSTQEMPPAPPLALSVSGGAELPTEFVLENGYPNPFNSSTRIRYCLPHSSFATFAVYNTLGQQIAQLVNEQQQTGYHDVVFRGDGLASGVYFYRLQAGDFIATKKLLLLK